jgi:anaerobic ribonucleoside-triphosphate reductase activating protein
MTAVAISRLHFPVTTLGPGRRIGVWFQGCSIACKGCISPDTWSTNVGWTSVDKVAAALKAWASTADGLTVTGGEPFDQPEALAALLSAWQAMSEADVLIFTGYELPRVQPVVDACDGLIDAIVSGPFDRHATQHLALRGSDNQSLHILTERGAKFGAFERRRGAADRRLDLMLDAEGGAWFAGIPTHNDFSKLQAALRRDGAIVQRPVEPRPPLP